MKAFRTLPASFRPVRGRVALGGLLSWLLFAGAGSVVLREPASAQEQSASGLPEWVEDAVSSDPQDPEPTPWEDPEPAPEVESEGQEPPPEPEFPAPATWDVALRAPGEAAAVDRATVDDLGVGSAANLPVQLTPGAATPVGAALGVKVLDRPVAERLGMSGFVFTVSETSDDRGRRRRDEPQGRGPRVLNDLATDAVPGGLPAELSLDYSGFAHAYGGDFAQRLKVVALPDCVLEEPLPEGCNVAGTRLPSQNDLGNQKLKVNVADLSALAAGVGVVDPAAARLAATFGESSADAVAAESGSVAVMAVTSGTGSDAGNYAATPISSSASWNVSPGSGEFSWSYPMDVPAPAGGSAPSVGMGYSSGAVDGLTLATNSQATQNGLGWSDFANAFIERSYEPCVNNTAHDGLKITDLCWKNDNATISLAGVSGPLVPVNPARSEWRPQTDPGWKIERLRGPEQPAWSYWGRQMWKVTAPDGTVYEFGAGHQPGQYTNSVLTVPVFSDHDGEPSGEFCWGEDTRCTQAWRWYLDRVVDPDGNVTSYGYEKETNAYSPAMGWNWGERYVYDRAATLKWIVYGGRNDVWDDRVWSARIRFETQYRCVWLNPQECTFAPSLASGLAWPDVPVDLICEGRHGSSCNVHAPSFFSGKRYSSVTTEVKVRKADSGDDDWNRGWVRTGGYTLAHEWPAPFDGSDAVVQKLQLKSIQQWYTNEGINDSPTTFGYIGLHNRADHDNDPVKQAWHRRLNLITNPFGGQVSVSYDYLSCVQPPNDRWDLNPTNCFPQTTYDNGNRRTGIFIKYMATSVHEKPIPGDPSQDIVTRYIYEEEPAWGFDRGAFDRDDHLWGWSRWLGYGTTTITKGTSVTRVRSFRGWNGDVILTRDGCFCQGEHGRDEPVQYLTSPGTVLDNPELAGRVMEEVQLGTVNGVAGEEVTTTQYTYTPPVKTFNDVPDYYWDPTWTGVATVTEKVATAPGVFRSRSSTTSYRPLAPNAAPQAVSTQESGWTDVSGDERCSRTSYAVDPQRWMLSYPASNTLVAGACDSTTVLTKSETLYDGTTAVGAAPTRGNPTKQRTLVDAGADTWSEVSTEYDYLGRPTEVTDPNGAVTTTTYTARQYAYTDDQGHQVQVPEKTVVTNPLGHTETTNWNEPTGRPASKVDANGNTTSFHYNSWHRLIGVRLPTEQGSSEYSWQFAYDLANRHVRSRRLTSMSGGTPNYEDTWVLYDGFWRERQTQSPSPTAGKVLVSETTYDDRGLVKDELVPQAFDGTPGTYINGGTAWANRTRHVYDELGRDVEQQWWRGTSPAHATTTAYGPDTVTVTGPDGVRVREQVDGLGRTISTAEHDGQGWVASSYQYDLADRLQLVTDPENNKIAYVYDNAGRRTIQFDSNRGIDSFGYDLAGNLTRVDSGGNKVFTIYDALGRPKERRSGSTTGPLLASWAYDATGQKGLLKSSTSHTSMGSFVSEVTSYDTRNRALGTKLTVPSTITGLAGSYTTAQTYDLADRVTSTTYPAMGDLTEETVNTTYGTMGLPQTMTGAATYVSSMRYDDRGRPTVMASGPAVADGWSLTAFTFDGDQRLSEVAMSIHNGSAYQQVAKHTYGFRNDGLLTEKTTLLNGAQRRECFGYDARARMTAAYTVAVGDAARCASSQRGTGSQPYNHSYAYSPAGNMTRRVEDGVTSNYTYPPAGGHAGSIPNAPTAVGADTYRWNGQGQLTQRTVGGRTESFAWDVQKMLQSVTGPDGQTSFAYDADGERLIRKTPSGTTLYFAGTEVTTNSSGGNVRAVRSYSFEGSLIATRSAAGVDYLASDGAGSVEMAIPSGGTPNATRAYDPYGSVRNETGNTATDRGFLGQVEDSSTNLSYLNARYYDASSAVFLSADPVYDTKNVKSLNPFSYAGGNPATFSDPSGTSRSYIFGLEWQNSVLRGQNAELMRHIGALNGKLLEAQDIINEQSRVINELLTHISALESIISQMQSIIEELQGQVRYLQRVVNQQARTISKLYGQISYYKGVIGQLVDLAYIPDVRPKVLASIWAFKGLPAGMEMGTYAFAHFAAMINLNYLRGQMSAMPMSDNEPRGVGGGCGCVTAEWNARWAELEADYWKGKYDDLNASVDPTLMSFGEQTCYYATGSGRIDYTIGDAYRDSAGPLDLVLNTGNRMIFGNLQDDTTSGWREAASFAGEAFQWVPYYAAATSNACFGSGN